MHTRRWRGCLGVLLVCVAVRTIGAADAQTDCTWKVGLARVKITPQRPVALLGYGDRTGPFESVAADIYAKAMALEDQRGRRAVLVTADLVGFQAAVVTDEVCRRISEKTGLERRQLLFNASHCHTGPLVSLDPHPRANSVAHPPLSPDDVRETVAYTQQLRSQLVDVVRDALADLQPAQLAWGTGQIGFPMNRRLPQDVRVVMADNPAGPTDRSVPVMRVQAADGRLLAVLFGCACHNTTLTGRDNVIAGDYAGFAQEMIERDHGKAMALFMSGCGADANPSPRGSMELARQHGEALAREVGRVLAGELTTVTGDLVTTLRYVELPLQQLSREEITARRQVAFGRSGDGAADARGVGPRRTTSDQLSCTAGRLAIWPRPDAGRSAGRTGGRIRVALAADARYGAALGRRLQQRLFRLSAHGPHCPRGWP